MYFGVQLVALEPPSVVPLWVWPAERPPVVIVCVWFALTPPVYPETVWVWAPAEGVE